MKLPTAWGLRNASPFNMKAEALLTLSGVAFDTVEALPFKGPKGKLPALKTPDGVIGDSSLIQRYLEENHGFDLDQPLSERDRADALAYRKMVEEWLYFATLHARWILEPKETIALLEGIPGAIRPLVFRMLRRRTRQTLHGQGIGRHSDAEILAFGCECLDALDARIGDGPYFFGDTLYSVDAAIYPHIVNLVDAPHRTSLNDHARALPRLVEYAERCDLAIFGGDATT